MSEQELYMPLKATTRREDAEAVGYLVCDLYMDSAQRHEPIYGARDYSDRYEVLMDLGRWAWVPVARERVRMYEGPQPAPSTPPSQGQKAESAGVVERPYYLGIPWDPDQFRAHGGNAPEMCCRYAESERLYALDREQRSAHLEREVARLEGELQSHHSKWLTAETQMRVDAETRAGKLRLERDAALKRAESAEAKVRPEGLLEKILSRLSALESAQARASSEADKDRAR